MKAHEAKRDLANGTGRDKIREVEASLVQDAAITLPPPISRHPNWWASLSRGDGHRKISPEAATFIIKAVATDVLGAQRAEKVTIDLDDPITLSDVWNALGDIPGGWEALVRRGES